MTAVTREDEQQEEPQTEDGQDTANTAGDLEDGQASQDDGQAVGQEEDAQAEDTTAGGENGSDGVYTVEEGDTLAIISKKMYGDVDHVEAICKMNGITDGNLIYVGQKLLLP